MEEVKNTIEIRAFLQLNSFIRERYGSMPLILPLDKDISGVELAKILGIALDEVEVIFINGFVKAIEEMIYPGDRIAFLPPGCPGPYRIALGFYDKNQNNPANFKIKGRQKDKFRGD